MTILSVGQLTDSYRALMQEYAAIERSPTAEKSSATTVALYSLESKVSSLYRSILHFARSSSSESEAGYEPLVSSIRHLQSLAKKTRISILDQVLKNFSSESKNFRRNPGVGNLAEVEELSRLESLGPTVSSLSTPDSDRKRSLSGVSLTPPQNDSVMSVALKRFCAEPSGRSLASKPFFGVKAKIVAPGKSIYNYSQPDLSVSFESSPSLLISQVKGKDLEIKKQLRVALQAVLVDYPLIGSMYKLAITAEIVRKITGIEPTVWNEEILLTLCQSLGEVPLEYPGFSPPDIAGRHLLYEKMQWIVRNAPKDNVAAFASNLRSIILAAPGLIPSHLSSLATQAYHQVKEKLVPLDWTQDDMLTQLTQILYCLYTAKKNHEERLNEKVARLPLEVKQHLKTVLYAVLIEISGLNTDQRIFLALDALGKIAQIYDVEYTVESLKALYASLEDVPFIVPVLTPYSSEGLEALRTKIQQIVQNLSLEELQAIRTQFHAIIIASPVLSKERIFNLANQCLATYGIKEPAWTDESPLVQVGRFLYFATPQLNE